MSGYRGTLAGTAAALLALAAGVALGAGPLQGDVADQLRAQVDTSHAHAGDLREQLATAQQRQRFDVAFGAAVEPTLVHGRLAGHRVLLVVLPGAPGSTVAGLHDAVTAAGASVTATVRFSAKWADPTERQFLDDLSARVIAADTQLPNGGTAYDRAGAVLAGALVAKGAKAVGTVDAAAPTILTAFDAGGVIDGPTAPQRADLTLLVVPPTAPADATDADAAWLALARAFDRVGAGTVVAGGPGAAGKGGVIAALRADAATSRVVSSVDVADRASGQVAVVLALAGQAAGHAGQYGAGAGAGAALPPLGKPAG